jgi:hypothetical protein
MGFTWLVIRIRKKSRRFGLIGKSAIYVLFYFSYQKKLLDVDKIYFRTVDYSIFLWM